MKTKAIAIRRVSSKRQEENNHSMDQQDTSVQNMATILGAEIVMEWAMATSAKKGKNLKRKDLQLALNYCRYNRGVKYLFIAKVSRFMRELKMLFYYMVEFEKLGVKVIFCDPDQQKYNADNADAMYELAKKAHQAEAENEERSQTSITKMKERVRLGYYPFYPHQGYVKTEAEDGLHIPDDFRWPLLKQALKATSSFQMTDKEAQKWLAAQGYRTPIIYRKDEYGNKIQKGNRILDLDHFRGIMKDPYYAGILKIRDWDINMHGLHKAMIEPFEWEINEAVANGKTKRRKLQFNPEFRLNKAYHFPCVNPDDPRAGRLTGIWHNNGKGWGRNEYVCRTCKKRIARDVVHSSLDTIFENIELDNESKAALLNALRKVWRNNEAYRIDSLTLYTKQKAQLVSKKGELISALSANPDLADDIKEEINRVKQAITEVSDKLAELNNIDEELEAFTEFALDYVESLKGKWWDLPGESLLECKQLVFDDVILVEPDGKVYTPKLSPIYTLQNKNDDRQVAENAYMVGFWGSARLIFPVIEAVAKTLYRKRGNEDERVPKLLQKLGIPYPDVVWQMYRNSLAHSDHLVHLSRGSKTIGWSVTASAGGVSTGHIFAGNMVHIDTRRLYEDFLRFLDDEITHATTNLYVKTGLKVGVKYTGKLGTEIKNFP